MSGRQESVNLDDLSPQQLGAVKKQLDEEVEHLSTSFSQLMAAQGKFRECLRCVQGKPREAGKKVLVPLTNSLYVGGALTDPEHVIVDIGTGFYVEKELKSAAQFYEDKIKELTKNIQELEAIVQNKTSSLRVVEEVLRQKVLASPA
ncbi:prefoldin subunit [Niveomyces insectorum RCEF 264]|uniref:Prefoldin subunit n=1 Tax=Niveomyces insectorum RCEF 264 TaxID=1081102 RepID=A0A167U1B9_9HYPO|nr:prefoldin subunit [Niveomyces insectorum RCEF 264]